MKKSNLKYIIPFALASVLFAGCENLQDSLSSEMQNKVNEETGIATINGKEWFYNGTIDEDMSESSAKHGLLVSFGKKVAIGTLSGSIELNYTNAVGNPATEVFSPVTGTFSEDFTGFRVNLSEVMAFFDTRKIPGGTASINLKLGGFKCAEGNQNGRAIPTFEAKNIQIKPLYNSYTVDFSTAGFSSDSKIEYDLKGNVSLLDDDFYEITSTGSDSNSYAFAVTTDGNKIVLKPKFETAPEDGVSVPLTIKGIVPVNGGYGFEKDITINFSKYSIVVDGKLDANYLSDAAVTVEDASGDQSAFAGLGYDVSSECDIQKVYITNDDDFVYVGVEGDLKLSWGNALSILVSNGKVTGAQNNSNGAKASVTAASTETYAKKTGGSRGQYLLPNVYLTHQPGDGNTGSGALSAYAYVSSANTDITANVKAAPKGWTDSTCGTFLEYAIPLSGTGLSKGDSLNVIVVAALHWNEGNAIVDSAKDDSVTYKDDNHTSVEYDLNNGISYTIK